MPTLVATFPDGQAVSGLVPLDSGDYFDSLTLDPACERSYSLRPRAGAPMGSPHYAKQLLGKSLGGYAESSTFYDITYDPLRDLNPEAQDAAKITIPVWLRTTWALEQPMSATDTILPASWIGKAGWANHSIRFASGEIAEITGVSFQPGSTMQRQLTLQRGTFGTTPQAYASGDTIQRNTPSLQNNLYLPLGTVNGHTYLFTYEFYCTQSCVNPAPHDFPIKSFQFRSGPEANKVGIWLEQRIVGRALSATQVGAWNFRYNGAKATLGPNVTDEDPLSPSEDCTILPGRWYRVWIAIEQHADDYDLMSSWIADAAGVTQIHRGLQITVGEAGIVDWYVEFNSSNDHLYNLIPKVIYLRHTAQLGFPWFGVDLTPYLRTEGL